MLELLQQKKKNYSEISEKLSVYDEIVHIRTLPVGTRVLGKTYLILKTLSRLPDRDIYLITKMPPEQYFNFKSKIKK